MSSDPVELQTQYWRFDDAEYAALRSRFPAQLSWAETLRLHHLACLDLLRRPDGRRALESQTLDSQPGNAGGAELCRDTARKMHSPDSPYRPRACAVWQGEPGVSGTRGPDLFGQTGNASLTHLGCLEVIRLDRNQEPAQLAFVGLDELRGALFLGQAVFRHAKLLYDDERGEEIVMLPLLYGVSWQSPHDTDRDGSFTRFICSVELQPGRLKAGIGVGHQDFLIEGKDRAQLLGLGSVGELMTALAPDDPKFERKCAARGLDPIAVRAQMSRR
jgi:hypothetical protein